MILIAIITSAIMTLVTYGAFIVVFSFMAWMAIDAAKQDRFWWIVIILGVPFIGGVVYYITEKKHQYVKAKSHHVHESQTESQHETTPKEHRHQKETTKSNEESVTKAEESKTHVEKVDVGKLVEGETEIKEEIKLEIGKEESNEKDKTT